MSDTGKRQEGTATTRSSVVRFAVTFLVSATVMLTGYDLAERTTANDWYLLQVANSCSVLLKAVGYSCEVGRADRFAGREREVRVALAAWRQGVEPGAEARGAGTGSDNEPPLSQWESWAYEAGMRHRNPQGDPVFGPKVAFVLKASVQRQLADARKQLAALQGRPEADAKAVNALQDRIAQLQGQIGGVDSDHLSSGKEMIFSFMVVPDCGAVPIVVIFAAAVLAFPVRWRARIAGTLVGSFVLFWVNALRLMVLAVVGALDHGGPIYRFMHEYLWQAVYIVFVIAVWLVWVAWATRGGVGDAKEQASPEAAP